MVEQREPTFNILIVDDNSNNLISLQSLIQEYLNNIKVLQAKSGLLALSVLMSERADLIILDIQMPDMDGFETAKYIRERQSMKHVPIVFLTAAYKSEEFKQRGFSLGAADYLTKPIDNSELINKLRSYLHFIKQEHEHNEALSSANARLKREMAQHQQAQLANAQLTMENARMTAELDVARHLQQLILPKPQEFKQFPQLDLAVVMETVTEVGGDYYDIIADGDDLLLVIADVEGHGIESGIVMMSLQTALRTLLATDFKNLPELMAQLNRIMCKCIARFDLNKHVTLSVLHYKAPTLTICGQHEEVLIFRRDGHYERIDTSNLGFLLGISAKVSHEAFQSVSVTLASGEGVVLYTDGITEATNLEGEMYDTARLCQTIQPHWQASAETLCSAVLTDVKAYLGQDRVQDDMTLLVMKQK